jgi:hypothetical protein
MQTSEHRLCCHADNQRVGRHNPDEGAADGRQNQNKVGSADGTDDKIHCHGSPSTGICLSGDDRWRAGLTECNRNTTALPHVRYECGAKAYEEGSIFATDAWIYNAGGPRHQ